MFKILVFSFVLFGLTFSNQYDDDASKRGANINAKYTFEFLCQCYKKNPGNTCSTMLYPLLITAGQVCLFSKGKTYEEALDFQNLKNRTEVRKLFPAINDALYDPNQIGSPTLNFNVYTDKNNKVCPAFKYALNRTFGGKTRVVDYSDPEEAADEINDEVRNTGSSGFKDLISSKRIKEGAGLNFISAYELTVRYDKQFKRKTLTTIKFQSGDKVQTVPGVFGQGIVKYGEIDYLDAKTIEIKGEGGILAYHIIIPKKRDGLKTLLEKLTVYNNFESIISQGKKTCARVTVPRKLFTSNIDLGKSARESNYLKSFFKEGGLQLDGATQKCNTYISSVLAEFKLNPGPLDKDLDTPCTEYPVEFVGDYPYVYIVTYTKKAFAFRTPILAVAVDIGI